MKQQLPPDTEVKVLLALYNEQLYEKAESRIHVLLAQYPDFAFGWQLLGGVLQMQGKNAVPAFQKVTELTPKSAEAHYNLGVALKTLGHPDAAAGSYRMAIALKPNYAEAHSNLGNIQKSMGQLDNAASSYRYAIAIKPALAEAHHSLGSILKKLGQTEAALASYRRAIEIKPNYAEALHNLGIALKELGQLDAAATCYLRAIEIEPNVAETHNNLGNVQKELCKMEDAINSFRRAIQIKPTYAEAHNNLGISLKDMGKYDEALDCYRRALEIMPDSVDAQTSLLFTLNYHPDLSGEEIYRAYREFNVSMCIPLRSTWRTHSNIPDPDRRLRIGYVSPDFQNHSCRSFLEPLLAHHDETRVEVFAYAELVREDGMTARYKSYIDHWIATRGMSDEALAERIRNDGIDILIDLAGHTAGNRLLTFARKPAPVSLSWMGYGYTTGLSAIDYFLTDAFCVPVGSEGLFAEQPWRVTAPAYTYRPVPGMGEVSSLPAQQRGYVTFGTLTRAIRINHRTVQVWATLLNTVPGSRLVIDSLNFKDTAIQEHMAAQFAKHGIARQRLEIGYHSPPWNTLRGIDIGLDCFPHNSGATLFETLYMGVPYVTLSGRPSVGRLGASILQSIGHPEWIAYSDDQYVQIAAKLASNPQQLAASRAGLREEMESSPFLDETGFTHKVEDAYRQMWRVWCKNCN